MPAAPAGPGDGPGDGPGRGPARAPPRRRARRAATVTFAKLALVGCAVSVSLLVAVWPELGFHPSPDLPETDALDGAGRHTAENPRLTGTDRGGRRYLVTADLMVQVDEENFRFDRPRATLTLGDGRGLRLSAREGVYRRSEERFHLSGAVRIESGDGHGIETRRAVVDLSAGVASGADRVRGAGPLGSLDARGFRIRDGGSVVTFSGPARLVIRRRGPGAPGGGG